MASGLLSCKTSREVSDWCQAELDRTRTILDEILRKDNKRRTIQNTLVPYDALVRIITEVSDQGELLFNVHPQASVRDAANQAYLSAKKFLTELSLNRSLYEAIKSLPLSKQDKETRYAVWKIRRDFRLAGVDRDEETRTKIKALNDEIAEIGATFDRNINEDVRSITVDNPNDLSGLPQDYLAAHPPKDGRITISTTYPDAGPVFRYAHNEDVRRRLTKEFFERGYPKNLPVLERLLERRHELASTLGYENFASYVTKDKMIRSAEAARKFVDGLSKATESRMSRDTELLLERKRKDHPEANDIELWDDLYYTERVRAEQFDLDSKQIRPYLEFGKVRDGIFYVASRLFGIRFRPVNVQMWHESVETYDVYEGKKRLGRIYLDLHPRDGKYTQMATYWVAVGAKGKALPQVALVCNFPDPTKSAGPALMEHSQVTIFFHEFGHLLHFIFSGKSRWLITSMPRIEWDFVEVPSQLFEEWAVKPESLRLFAKNSKGKPINIGMIERLHKAKTVARGLFTREDIFYAALSLAYYSQDPKSTDTTSVVRELWGIYLPIPWPEGTHFQCSFWHLNSYSATYYTYLWSLVIEKDLFSRFLTSKTVLDAKVARRYRRFILEAGSKRPASEMVKQFLGRGVRIKNFQTWLNEGSDKAETEDTIR